MTTGPPTPVKQDQARTRLARAAVVQAARGLFLERGYGAATIEAISDVADVPPATVYRLFGSKLGILKSLLDVSIVGDDDETPMAARPQVQTVLAKPHPTEQLAGFVTIVVQVNTRIAPVYRILVSAAGSDPDAAALLEVLTTQRQRGQRSIARSLASAGALRTELRERDAADIIHALLSPEMYRLLVLDRSWGLGRYERWLATTLIDQLLPARSPGSERPE